MITSYFTFGQIHTHSCNGITLDKDCVVKITAADPRARMFELFGRQWGFEYQDMPAERLKYFPRGIIAIE